MVLQKQLEICGGKMEKEKKSNGVSQALGKQWRMILVCYQLHPQLI